MRSLLQDMDADVNGWPAGLSEREYTFLVLDDMVETVVRFMCLVGCWQGPFGASGGKGWRNNNA